MKRQIISMVLLVVFLPATQSRVLAQAKASVAEASGQVAITVLGDEVQFSSPTPIREIRVQIATLKGQAVFDSGALAASSATWSGRDELGLSVPDGVYLVTITVKDKAGKVRHQSESVAVQRSAAPTAPLSNSAPGVTTNVAATLTGEGTIGMIPKWVGINQLGDSIMTEKSGKIGINNTAPSATLHIIGQVVPDAAGAGGAATALLIMSGGKGGNSTGAAGGAGAAINLRAGGGGDSAGGTNGTGGTITLIPGPAGTGGSGGSAGRIILAPSGGNVGIGTTAPSSLLTVAGVIQSTTGGVKFPDNTVQTTAANVSVPLSLSGNTASDVAIISGTNTGAGIGVSGDATDGSGVSGNSSNGPGVTATSSFGNGVNASSGSANGVFGSSSLGNGVIGSTSSGSYGVSGIAQSSAGTGVSGSHSSFSGTAPGVLGTTGSTDANAVGVQGVIPSTAPGTFSAGVKGINNGTGGNGFGVYGTHGGSGQGVYGTSISGIGTGGGSTSGNGVSGQSLSGTGVFGTSTDGPGVSGSHTATTGTSPGVQGDTSSTAANAIGVQGTVTSTSPGGFSAGVKGVNSGTGGAGVGVYGSQAGSGYGVYGTSPSGKGVFGSSTSGIGVYGTSTSGNAGYFSGDVVVTGTLSKGGGSFKIDDPLDPANKYLSHSFVESPDMMNIYNGNITTDAKGQALVVMPRYFETLNRDYRYQLTVIGTFAQAIVANKIKNGRFVIKTDKPNVEVSWQVTGVRQDAWANAHRIPTEQDKIGDERGRYLHPAEYGQPLDKGIAALHNSPATPGAVLKPQLAQAKP